MKLENGVDVSEKMDKKQTTGIAADPRAEAALELLRSLANAGDDPDQRGSKESALAAPVSKLIALAEDYPDLKASDNFKDLQDELSETENKIEMARRFYNGAVRELNVAIESFPGNLLAGPFGFVRRAFFEISTADRAVPEIGLGGQA